MGVDDNPGRPDLVPILKKMSLADLSAYCSVVLSLNAGIELVPQPLPGCVDCGEPLQTWANQSHHPPERCRPCQAEHRRVLDRQRNRERYWRMKEEQARSA